LAKIYASTTYKQQLLPSGARRRCADTVIVGPLHDGVSVVTLIGKGAITSKINHAIKLKTSPARLAQLLVAQLLQPSLAFCFSLQPMTAYRPLLQLGEGLQHEHMASARCASLQCESKKSPLRFCGIFPNRFGKMSENFSGEGVF